MAHEVKMRTFLALPIAGLFQSEVTPLLENLRQEHPEVRWVLASQIHVTLHFFGSIGPEDFLKISERVGPVAKKTKPFQLLLEGLGVFPNLHRPRVIWLGMKGGTEALKIMQISIEKELSLAGFRCEDREFKPHLTIGRVKEGKKFSGLSSLKFGPTPAKRVKELILFQSHLMPQGARYEAVQTYPLSLS